MVKVLLDDLNFFSILRCISLYKTQFQIVSLQKSKQSKFSTLFLKALSIQCDLLPQDIDNLFATPVIIPFLPASNFVETSIIKKTFELNYTYNVILYIIEQDFVQAVL